MKSETWETSISKIAPNEIRLRGYRIDELMGQLSFSEVIYLLFMGELPEPGVKLLLDAIFISSIDHGVTPPSAFAARNAASTGAPLNAAVAAGVLSINDYHGGAIGNCVKVLSEVLESANNSGSVEQSASEMVNDYLLKRKKMPGFGHRIHTNDPRTQKLLQLAEQTGVSGDGVCAIKAIENAFEVHGKKLPINVDGAIAAIIFDLKIPVELANAFFVIARVPGMFAQAYEEKTTQSPMRMICTSLHVYSGKEDRSLEARE